MAYLKISFYYTTRSH